MSNTNTGGPAFPTLNEHQAGPTLWQYTGMTLRDYFAAKAMQGICANEQTAGKSYDEVSLRAWKMADAMLKAREQ